MTRDQIFRIKMLIAGLLLILTMALSLHVQNLGDTDMAKRGELLINEVCSSNFSAAADENEEYHDYVELYNPSETSYEGTVYLSDSGNDMKKYEQNISVRPGEYLVVWLYGEAKKGTEHEGFGISKKGEEVILSNDRGKVLDVINVPPLPYNTSYGRTADGSTELCAMSCTCGYTNEGAERVDINLSEPPVFSLEDGFYPEGTSLTIEHFPWESVYVTMDGSLPTESSMLYQGPIELVDASDNDNVYADISMYLTYSPPDYKIDKANVVRAVKVNKITGKKSKVGTHVYFVGFDDKKEYGDIPIISLVIDPEELFDPHTGIFVMGDRYEVYKEKGGFVGMEDEDIPAYFIGEDGVDYWRMYFTNANVGGRESEKRAVASVFEGGAQVFSGDIGVRVAGESSRYQPQKSLNLFARNIYDDSVSFDFWGRESDKVRLRRGDDNLIFRASFVQSLQEGGTVPCQKTKPVILFLDGEYWGVYGLTEQYTADYFARYGIEEDNLWLVKNDVTEYGDEDTIESYHYLLDMMAYADPGDEEVYSEICNQVDIDNLIDYYCFLIYFDNEDIEARHNQSLFRAKEESGEGYADGKWRYVLYDMDETCKDVTNNTIEFYREKDDNMYVPGALYSNPSFREAFRNRMYELMDTDYSYENIHKKLMEWDAVYRDQVIATVRRFDDHEYSAADYEEELRDIDEFFRLRRGYVEQYLEEDLANH